MVKQNRTRAARDAKSTATSTNTAESINPLVSGEENEGYEKPTARGLQVERSATKTSWFYTSPDGKRVCISMRLNELFQNGMINSCGKVPFTEEQINLAIDNSFEMGILMDEYKKLEKGIFNFTDSDEFNFKESEKDELILCIKGIVKRRYAETIRAQKAAGIVQGG